MLDVTVVVDDHRVDVAVALIVRVARTKRRKDGHVCVLAIRLDGTMALNARMGDGGQIHVGDTVERPE